LLAMRLGLISVVHGMIFLTLDAIELGR